MDFLYLLSYVQYQRNKFQPAQKTIEGLSSELETLKKTTLHLIQDYESIYVRASVFKMRGYYFEAKNEAESMKKLVDEFMSQSQYLPDYYHLRGTIALQEGKYVEAMDAFTKGYASLPYQNSSNDEHALFLSALAHLYYLNHGLDEAQKYYEDIQKLTTGRLIWGDLMSGVFTG